MASSRKYRGWTPMEDDKLVEALLTMRNQGLFIADNGFKPGYLQHIEDALKETIPESGILGKPHIESRLKTMRKDWMAVYDMLNGPNTSGFGFDNENNCVTTNAPGVWEDYLKTHKLAGKWKNKKLPHYEDLCVIFGKDRAKGNRAKVVTEMEDDMNIEEQEQESDDVFGEAMEDSHYVGTNTSVEVEDITSGRSKKRKTTGHNALLENFNNAVILFGDRIKESSAELSEAIKLEVDLDKKTSMITTELSKMTSLSQMERFKAIKKIKDDSNNVKTFWDLEEHERESWVGFIMSE